MQKQKNMETSEEEKIQQAKLFMIKQKVILLNHTVLLTLASFLYQYKQTAQWSSIIKYNWINIDCHHI